MDEEDSPRHAEEAAPPGAAARENSVSSSDSDDDLFDRDELDNLDNDNAHDGIRVEIAEQEIPVPEDADPEARRRGPRIELQIQIQLQTPNRPNPAAVEFDRSLPTQHSYLGENFSRVTGGRVYEPGHVCSLPLHQCKAQLMPGRKLPFMCDSPRQQAMVRHLTSGNDSMFAVLCTQSTRRGQSRATSGLAHGAAAAAATAAAAAGGEQPPGVGDIGCTAELMSYSTDECTDDIRVICKGLQRFQVRKLIPQITGLMLAEVMILPDVEPPAYPHHLLAARPQVFVRSPFKPAPSKHTPKPPPQPALPDLPHRRSPQRSRNITERVAEAMYRALGMAASQTARRIAAEERAARVSDADNSTSTDAAAAPGGEAGGDSRMDAEEKRHSSVQCTMPKHCGLLCSVPLRAFHECSYERVVERVFKELLPWRSRSHLSRHELVPFSYYVLASMPLDEHTQRELLAVDSALIRLQRILTLMLSCRHYCCSQCGRRICRRDKVMSMSDDGPSALYVNQSNIVTEMFTVRDTIAFACAQLRPSSTDFSWFPGYSWCCSICISCSNHLGWIFETDDPQVSPQQFFGLVQSKVVPDFATDLYRSAAARQSASSRQHGQGFGAGPPPPPPLAQQDMAMEQQAVANNDDDDDE
ncbi:protein cereblon-like [Sycon ciliatum]|uniref:protein cereblon-like n=1 Tax=Sycon ciliatum TaxID=27933 RepID=UPI0020AC0981|eukprot:scpid64696/ scgid29309/ Protein cereblon